MPDRRRISKLLSLILRHRPDEFGLNMDEYGFIPLDEVVESVQQRYDAVAEDDVRDLIGTSRQHRFEIVGDKVRALYGHSFFVKMDGEPMEAPEHLFLCVDVEQGKRMKAEGIRSEDRFYLHLSPTREVAESRAGSVDAPCVVEVRAAAAAAEADVKFWSRGEVVLTREEISSEYVGELVEIEVPEGSRQDEGDRPRRRQGGRGGGRDGARSSGNRDSGNRQDSDGPRRPSRPAPSRATPAPEAAPAPEPPKEPSFGRRAKFNKGSGRR